MPRFCKFNYTIKNAEGEVVDSSVGGDPISFVEGDGRTIKGLEVALQKRKTGDEFQVSVEPDQAYGWSQRSLIRTVSTEMFDSNVDDIEVGMVFQVGSGESSEVAKVIEIAADGITIDTNHPLAGITFHFDIQVLEAREATAEEVEFSQMTGSGDSTH